MHGSVPCQTQLRLVVHTTTRAVGIYTFTNLPYEMIAVGMICMLGKTNVFLAGLTLLRAVGMNRHVRPDKVPEPREVGVREATA